MKTPINGARLSSKWDVKHPILGYNKMHQGTDFAAPMGTDNGSSGKILQVGVWWWQCIKIRHNSTYFTVYAHVVLC